MERGSGVIRGGGVRGDIAPYFFPAPFHIACTLFLAILFLLFEKGATEELKSGVRALFNREISWKIPEYFPVARDEVGIEMQIKSQRRERSHLFRQVEWSDERGDL